MDRKNRLFYRTKNRGKLESVDCTLVESSSQATVFHTDQESDIQAISVYDDSTEFLFEDGTVDKYTVVHRRMKEASSEIYFHGGAVYNTEAKVHFLGEYQGSASLPEYKSSTKVRINNCEIAGTGSTQSNKWEWDVINEGSVEFIKRDQGLSDELDINSTLMCVGLDDSVDTLELCQSVI